MTSKTTRKPVTASEQKEFSDIFVFNRGPDEIPLVGNMQSGVLTYPHTEEARASLMQVGSKGFAPKAKVNLVTMGYQKPPKDNPKLRIFNFTTFAERYEPHTEALTCTDLGYQARTDI